MLRLRSHQKSTCIMSPNLNYYEILQIEESATLDEVKKAYRTLALQYHPDKNKDDGSEEKFKQINRAYTILSDPQKRATYDRRGDGGFNDDFDIDEEGFMGITVEYLMRLFAQRAAGRRGGGRVFFFGSSRGGSFGCNSPYCDCDDYGSGSSEESYSFEGKQSQEPMHVELPLTIYEVFTGCTKEVKFSRKERFPDGEIRSRVKKFEVKVRPGAKEGTTVKLAQEGDQLPGKIPQDVIVTFKDLPNKSFVRNGHDVTLTVKISKEMAENGGQVEIQMLDRSTTKIDVAPNTEDSTVKVFNGLGLPIPFKPNKRGDLLVSFKIKASEASGGGNQNRKKKQKKGKK